MCVLNHSDGAGVVVVVVVSPRDFGRGCGRGGGGLSRGQRAPPDTGAFGDCTGMQLGVISPGGREWASLP